MQKNGPHKHAPVQQALNIIWMFLTVIFLIFALYFQWLHNEVEKQHQVSLMTNSLRVKIDNLIENALKSVYALPLYGRNLEDCKPNLLSLLKSAVFNNPIISDIVISDDQNKIICSTLGKKYVLPPFSVESPALFGPLKIDNLRENAFLLQQKLGNYHLGVYIVESLIQNILSSMPKEVVFAGLYNQRQRKFILYEGVAPLKRQHESEPHRADAQLQNLDAYKIVLIADPKHFTLSFIFRLLIAISVILFLSMLIYWQLRNVLNKRFSLIYALQVALKNNSFQPVYQPVMDCEQNRYCGAEILLRWQTDRHEILPESFIEEAEQSGLIVPITLQVLRKAFIELHHFLRAHPDFHLALNLSAGHFLDKHFFTKFYQLCEQYHIRPQQVMVELTERELFDQNNKALIAKMYDLRDRGHALAIDDFGTGHASIKYLQHFPFNYLKIDKIFVHAIGTGAITESLNQAIIHMGNSLKLQIIAEGVETKEQFMFLRQCHVRFMQGWFFEKAMPYERLIRTINGLKHEK
ncbi:EAL domain-containing protein [Legionella jamestowniensis]|uniref:Rtn protein n=1 Tax=Legionella jamestowniensis TaxID=455 RepID=A0A0W0UK34_9GAMM|nr:EAL domain-containing protein [Legionella jamestowniensis]KTD08267.1 Rtn protein [Legionella jamestowniensis]SFL97626.1 sensor c-di-GMP phosphodiesterase, contains CSS-motif sensor and EAL domain [Legionella jamestowniensis DSM 19215]